MRRTRALISLPTAVMAAMLGVSIGFQAAGQRAHAPAAPVVASVRIEKLFEELEDRAGAKAEIGLMQMQLDNERKQREEEIATLQANLDQTVAPAARAEIEDQLMLKQLQLQFWLQESVAVLEVERAIQIQNLYRTVRQAIAALAASEGYDLVIVNDSTDDLPFDRDPRVPAHLQVFQQIGARKVLYMNNAIDITEDLIVRMNNQFRVGP